MHNETRRSGSTASPRRHRPGMPVHRSLFDLPFNCADQSFRRRDSGVRRGNPRWLRDLVGRHAPAAPVRRGHSGLLPELHHRDRALGIEFGSEVSLDGAEPNGEDADVAGAELGTQAVGYVLQGELARAVGQQMGCRREGLARRPEDDRPCPPAPPMFRRDWSLAPCRSRRQNAARTLPGSRAPRC
jgi:hypothetical protein